MNMTFEMIEFFNSEAWVQVYNKLVALMDKSYIEEYFEEFSLENAEFSSQITIRLLAAQTFGALAEKLGVEDFSEAMFRRCLSLAQDPMYAIRQVMCNELKCVFRAVDTTKYQSTIFEEIMKLISDEVSAIRVEAVSLFADLLDIYNHKYLEEEVMPAVKNEILRIDDEAFCESVINSLPLMVRKLEAVMDETIESVLKFLTDVVDKYGCNDVCKSFVCMLPGIASTMGPTNFQDRILPIYSKLVTYEDLWPDILESLEHLLPFLGTLSNIMQPTISTIIKSQGID